MFVPTDTKTNIFIAAFTTAHARVLLYKHLQTADQKVLYFDTDFIIYVSRPGEVDLPTGNFLGDVTNELKPGVSIVEFVSLGPKNYAYLLSDSTSSSL